MQRRLKSVIINFEDNEIMKDPSFIKMERESYGFAKEKLIPSKRYNSL
jgi:hypothetical protein